MDKMCTYCSMNKQYLKGVQNGKKSSLNFVGVHSYEIFTFQ